MMSNGSEKIVSSRPAGWGSRWSIRLAGCGRPCASAGRRAQGLGLLLSLAALAVAPWLHAATTRQGLTEDERNSIGVFRSASPAVVYVTSTAVRRDLFSFNAIEVPQGSGSGFVWNTQGYIVTNFHVISGASRLLITLSDQSQWPAKVIGVAPEKDLAVLKVGAPVAALHTLPLGDSADLEVGRKVLAIGNPFGLDTTLTTGVVSALGREIEAVNDRKIRDVIQTDAAINPGNSGGPLLNSQGELIGVNTAIYSPSGASAGIGFAIPVNTVVRYVPQLIKYGRINRPVLGVEPVDERWSRSRGIEGVVIAKVQPGSPAAREVNSVDDMLGALEEVDPGETVVIRTVRERREQRYRIRFE